VDVFRKPRAMIIPTGNRDRAARTAAEVLRPGAILEVNGQVLASMIAECGGEAAIGETVPDNPARIKEAVTASLNGGYDLVLIIAGSSAGSEDHTPAVLAEMGELLVHGVTVMPGKPTVLAAVNDHPVVGIPGFPVSAAIAFREFVRPMLYRMQGIVQPETETIEAVIGRKLPSRRDSRNMFE